MSWVTIAVSVGTALVGAYQQHQVAKKQDNALAAQLRQQSAAEDKVRARTAQFTQQQQQQTDEPQKSAEAKAFNTAITANRSMANQPLANIGNVSDAYKKAGSDAALGIADYGKNLGNLTAAIDAPARQRQDNQRNVNDFGIDVNRINRTQQGQDFLAQMRLNSIHANPWVSLLTSAANGYARAKAGSGGASSSGYSLDGNTAAGGVDLSDPWSR